MLYLGGYSGECENSVEVVALLLALQVLYPHLISMLHSRLDEEDASGDLSNPCSLRTCCRKFCKKNETGDALWHSITDAICATPAAAVVQHNFFAAHMEPGRCRDVTPHDVVASSGDLLLLLTAYCKGPKDVLSHPSIAAMITASPLPEGHKGVKEYLLEDRILYFSGCFSSHKGHNGVLNTVQACSLSSGRITVYSWRTHHLLNDGTGMTATFL